MLFVLDIMQVTEPIVDLPTTGFNSQGMGTQTKTSNVTKHMPSQSQFEVPRQQMWRALYIAWFERQGHPCMISSQFLSVCFWICTIKLPPYRT